MSWRLPIALLFVDGLHDYSSVARDFFHFEPYLEKGGYVAFHDCDDNYLVVRAFVAGLAADGSFKEVARAASLVVLQKAVDLPQEPPGDLAGGVMALSRRVAQQQNGIEFLMREIASRELTIRARDEGIEWLRSVIRDKAMTIAELEKGVAWLRKEIAERDVRLEALQRASRRRPRRTSQRNTRRQPIDTAHLLHLGRYHRGCRASMLQQPQRSSPPPNVMM